MTEVSVDKSFSFKIVMAKDWAGPQADVLNWGKSLNCVLFYIISLDIPLQVDARDEEIERLNRSLEGGRPHDVISLESKNKSNERLIAHLNLQV